MLSFKWLIPGMRVKRWLSLLLAGTTLLALSIAYLLIDFYDRVELPPESPGQTWLSVATLLTLFIIPCLYRAMSGRGSREAVAPDGVLVESEGGVH